MKHILLCFLFIVSICVNAHAGDRKKINSIFDDVYYWEQYKKDISEYEHQKQNVSGFKSKHWNFLESLHSKISGLVDRLGDFFQDDSQKPSRDELISYFMYEGWKRGHNPNSWFDTNLFQKYYPSEVNPILAFMNGEKGSFKEDGQDFIVSLTSHPGRINKAYLAIESIMRQTLKPRELILFLAQDDFPEKKLPQSIEILKERGLKVVFKKRNFRVATKLLPALKSYPESTIITFDDDRIYHPELISALWAQHLAHPKCIISPSARRYVEAKQSALSGGLFGWIEYLAHTIDGLITDVAEIFGIFEGFSGVLYPPHALDEDVFDFNTFMALCPFADDVWFQVMAMKKGTKTIGLPKALNDQFRNPEEVDGTQEFGVALFHNHLSRNDVMLAQTLRHYGLEQKVGALRSENLHCKKCRREVKIDQEVQHTRATPYSCEACFNTSPKKILCIGAYDFGNIGDGSYKTILQKVLSEQLPECQLFFIPDNVLCNPDGTYRRGQDHDAENLAFDYLIIGGGGILREFSEAGSSIRYYVNLAREKGISYIFTSVGLQTTEQNPSADSVRQLLGSTKEMLEDATFIYVRSQKDQRLLLQVLDNCDHKLFVAPDLGYLIPKISPEEAVEKKYVTLIQTGSTNINEEHVVERLKEEFRKYPNAELVVMNWGGVEHPLQEKDFKEWDLFNEDLIKSKMPEKDLLVFRGAGLSSEIKDLYYKGRPTRESDLTLKQAINIIRQSHFVVTGRYHGMVFAKAFRIPWQSFCHSFKIKADYASRFSKPTSRAMDQIEAIVSFVKRDPGINGFKAPHEWDDPDRNHYISSLDNRLKSEGMQINVRHIQAMSNEDIWHHLMFGYKDRLRS